MADPRVGKFIKKGAVEADAENLVAAGLGTPKLVKAASDQAVEDAVGSGKLSAVRALFPAQ